MKVEGTKGRGMAPLQKEEDPDKRRLLPILPLDEVLGFCVILCFFFLDLFQTLDFLLLLSEFFISIEDLPVGVHFST